MSETPEQSPFSAAWRFAVGMLTVFPVRVGDVNRGVAGRGMVLVPFVGMALGLVAAVVLAVVSWLSGSSLLAAVLAVGTLAWLTRGLHLDGLADLADGLGSGKPAGPALEVMKRSDIGPFGVVTLVFTLLVQVAALSQAAGMAAFALVAACATGRLAATWACRDGIPAARPEGLGALVAGTVRRTAAIATTAAAAVVVAALALAVMLGAFVPWVRWCPPLLARGTGLFLGGPGETVVDAAGNDVAGLTDPAESGGELRGLAMSSNFAGMRGLPYSGPINVLLVLLIAMGAGLAAAWLLRRRAVRRLGGITGDVLGALVETATTVTLLVCVLL